MATRWSYALAPATGDNRGAISGVLGNSMTGSATITSRRDSATHTQVERTSERVRRRNLEFREDSTSSSGATRHVMAAGKLRVSRSGSSVVRRSCQQATGDEKHLLQTGITSRTAAVSRNQAGGSRSASPSPP